jgi:hypothetical protein
MACVGTAVACLTAFPACFGGPFAIVGEIAGTVLTSDVTGASSLLTILGKVARISGVLRFSHCLPHLRFWTSRIVGPGMSQTNRAESGCVQKCCDFACFIWQYHVLWLIRYTFR